MHHQTQFMPCWGRNPKLHACQASALPAELYPGPRAGVRNLKTFNSGAYCLPVVWPETSHGSCSNPHSVICKTSIEEVT